LITTVCQDVTEINKLRGFLRLPLLLAEKYDESRPSRRLNNLKFEFVPEALEGEETSSEEEDFE